ncbi:LOW QUALITY PROTEIN: DNA-binding protein RFX8 [Kogia breviceps]|uniref:LOW QUALITY PROTEIN: DNA-binding protein RFX8 n=1 Tax=Kogia breviceps TaxID=27615 RepID=UPI0034D2E962
MAEGVAASASGGAGGRGLHGGVIQWLVDNFCVCEGYGVPLFLMREIYVETCGQSAQNQVNPATFGKLVHLVFPDLGTWRPGTRGSARYHYDGICIKKSSFFGARYCCLLGEKRCHSGDVIASEKSTNYNKIAELDATGDSHPPNKTDPVGSPLSEFRRCPFGEQELAKKYSYKTMAFLADGCCNDRQDILQNVRSQELERVQDSLPRFWKSLQQDTVMLTSLPDVRQLLKCNDGQAVQEVTVFVKRLRRKTHLSNVAKTRRMVLKNSRRVSILRLDLHAIVHQGALDISKKALTSNARGTDGLGENTEMKCNPPSSAAWSPCLVYNQGWCGYH